MNAGIRPNKTPSSVVSDEQAYKTLNSSAFEPIPFCPEVGQATWRPMATTMRIPCRARRVCDSHTPQSAYFELPIDSFHGKTLVCSHPRCRDSGRIFRYCKVCNQVAAKRNFGRRHAHDADNDNQAPMPVPGFPLSRPDSPNSYTIKSKVSFDVEGEYFVDMIMGAILGEESTSESETTASRTSVAPSTDYTVGDQDSVFMMVSRSEAALLDLVRSRGSTFKVILLS